MNTTLIRIKDKEWNDIARKAHEVHEVVRHYEKIKKELFDQLRDLSQDQSCQSDEYKFLKIERKGTVDYDSITVLKLINIEKYRKPSTFAYKLTKE